MHQLQPLALNLLNHDAENLALCLLLFGQEYQTGAIFPLFGYGNALQQNELVGNLNHDARTVAILAHLSTTVAHIL